MLRNSALVAGGLPFTMSLFEKAGAAPLAGSLHHTIGHAEFISDREIALGMPVDLKARLFANENPFGPSDAAKKAVEMALPTSFQYPFMFLKDLTGKIASFEGISDGDHSKGGDEFRGENNGNILMAAGSSPLLMAAALYFSRPGANIITGDPSYADLPRKAAKLGAKIVKVPLTTEYKLDLDAMEKSIDSNTTLVYICNPNNPTATVLDTDKLKAFCERVSKRVPVFIDEAYIDYLPDPQGTTLVSGVKAGQNIIVARTFSKVYGFAGLRVGYIVAQPDMINKLAVYTDGASSISATSLQAAIASYQDRDYMNGVLKKTVASKAFLYDVLKKEGYEYVPSCANFVIFPIKMEGAKFTSEMMKRGVGVRYWQFDNKEWCRVSIGRMEEMQAFASAFKEIS